MRRILFFDYPGDTFRGNYLKFTRTIIERYKTFFKSDLGGCWENDEFIDLNTNKYFANISEFNIRLDESLSILNRCDFSIIVFVGHGCNYAELDRIQVCSPAQNIEDFTITIKSLYENIINTGKRMLIVDSCRTYLERRSINEYINESLGWENAGNRENNRNYYNQLIQKAPNHIEIIQSAQQGQSACTIPFENSSVFSKSLFSVLEQKSTAARQIQISGDKCDFSYIDMKSDVDTKMAALVSSSQISQVTTLPDVGNSNFPLIAVDTSIIM